MRSARARRRDAVEHRLALGGEDRHRRPQLVRDVRGQRAPQLVLALERRGHRVDRRRQLTELAGGGQVRARAAVAAPSRWHGVGQPAQRPRDPVRDDERRRAARPRPRSARRRASSASARRAAAAPPAAARPSGSGRRGADGRPSTTTGTRSRPYAVVTPGAPWPAPAAARAPSPRAARSTSVPLASRTSSSAPPPTAIARAVRRSASVQPPPARYASTSAAVTVLRPSSAAGGGRGR